MPDEIAPKTPKQEIVFRQAERRKRGRLAAQMRAAGATTAAIAESLGVSTSSVVRLLARYYAGQLERRKELGATAIVEQDEALLTAHRTASTVMRDPNASDNNKLKAAMVLIRAVESRRDLAPPPVVVNGQVVGAADALVPFAGIPPRVITDEDRAQKIWEIFQRAGNAPKTETQEGNNP